MVSAVGGDSETPRAPAFDLTPCEATLPSDKPCGHGEFADEATIMNPLEEVAIGYGSVVYAQQNSRR